MRLLRLAAPLLAASAAACGGDDAAPAAHAAGPDAPAAPASAPREAPAPPEPQTPLADDPRVTELADALETGDRDRAARLVLRLDDALGLDAALLRARFHALDGSAVEATRALEAARERWPRQGRVYAAQAELAAAAGRRETARDAIREGLAAVGPTPELERAQGIYFLGEAGTVSAGLAHLVKARERAPDLPFVRGPLAEAHRLVGGRALMNRDAESARLHARAGLAEAPGDPLLRELLADACEGLGLFAQSAEIWEEFLAAGRDCGGTLASIHQRAATVALVEGDRPGALEHWLRARALGLPEDELGHGATALAAEAESAIARGFDAFEAEDWPAAEAAFRDALLYAPQSLEARNHLAKVLCREERWSEAAPLFRAVWDGLTDRGEPLPEPVHLNLARALVMSGHPDEVEDLLERYLTENPDGAWVDGTREMLERVPAASE